MKKISIERTTIGNNLGDYEPRIVDNVPLRERFLEKRPDGTIVTVTLDPKRHSFHSALYKAAGASFSNEDSDYVTRGPLCQLYPGEIFGEEEIWSVVGRRGLDITAGLRSIDEETGVSTDHQVLVATIVDPESFVVPEDPAENSGENTGARYSIIGSNDPRFEPITKILNKILDENTPIHGEQAQRPVAPAV